MIYVECKPDEALVRTLMSLPRREIVHELKGKFEVIQRISGSRRNRGLVDEDPGALVPRYFASMRLAADLTLLGLKQYEDAARENHVTVLCPRLEEWLVACVRDSGLRMTDYGLPEQVHRLRAVINEDLRKVERIVVDLREVRSERMSSLRRLLSA